MKKISDSSGAVGGGGIELFGGDWHGVLCDYMANHQTPYVRRQARKLLLFICGSREKYRELRDIHMLQVSEHVEMFTEQVKPRFHNRFPRWRPWLIR